MKAGSLPAGLAASLPRLRGSWSSLLAFLPSTFLGTLTPHSGQLVKSAQVTPVPVAVRDPSVMDGLLEHPKVFWGADHARLPLHGTCSDPVALMISSGEINSLTGALRCRIIHSSAKCRKCPDCIIHRGKMWTARAISECEHHRRNWFVTLTFDWRHKVPEGSDPINWAQRQLTLYLKKVRKAGHKLRYLAVFELHKSGLPHIHMLVHAITHIKYRDLERDWVGENGFFHAKLVDGNKQAAAYVCKYLFKEKSIVPRQRASVYYGAGGLGPTRKIADFSIGEQIFGPVDPHKKPSRPLPTQTDWEALPKGVQDAVALSGIAKKPQPRHSWGWARP